MSDKVFESTNGNSANQTSRDVGRLSQIANNPANNRFTAAGDQSAALAAAPTQFIDTAGNLYVQGPNGFQEVPKGQPAFTPQQVAGQNADLTGIPVSGTGDNSGRQGYGQSQSTDLGGHPISVPGENSGRQGYGQNHNTDLGGNPISVPGDNSAGQAGLPGQAGQDQSACPPEQHKHGAGHSFGKFLGEFIKGVGEGASEPAMYRGGMGMGMGTGYGMGAPMGFHPGRYNYPGYGQPGFGQMGYGQPGYGQPGFGGPIVGAPIDGYGNGQYRQDSGASALGRGAERIGAGLLKYFLVKAELNRHGGGYGGGLGGMFGGGGYGGYGGNIGYGGYGGGYGGYGGNIGYGGYGGGGMRNLLNASLLGSMLNF